MSDRSPAHRHYLFGRAYRDVWDALAASWHRNVAEAGEWSERAGAARREEQSFAHIFQLVGGGGILVGGTVVAGVLALVHLCFVVVAAGVWAAVAALVWLTEFTFLRLRGFRVECPTCHEVSRLPMYACSACAVKHPCLEPGLAGVFHHSCRCGAELASTVFGPRSRLDQSCPKCEVGLQTSHFESVKVHVGLVGPSSAGKTAYLFAAISELMRRWQAAGGAFEFLEPSTRLRFEALRAVIADGGLPDATSDRLPEAFHLEFRRADGARRVVYLYDAAGEVWHPGGEVTRHIYHGRLAGLVLFLDPFSQPDVRVRCDPAVVAAVHPSASTAFAALEALLGNLERLIPDERLRQAIRAAAVLTKTDALPLALRSQCEHDPRTVAGEWGFKPTLDLLAARFRDTQLFRTAALRRARGAHRPEGTEASLLWLLQGKDPEFWRL